MGEYNTFKRNLLGRDALTFKESAKFVSSMKTTSKGPHISVIHAIKAILDDQPQGYFKDRCYEKCNLSTYELYWKGEESMYSEILAEWVDG